MEYKKCEHCGEEIHRRSQKCPFCNQTVAEVPEFEEEIKEEVNEENAEINNEIEQTDDSEAEVRKTNTGNMYPPQIQFEVGPNGQPKDYVYKAEVRHSLQYTNPLSNMAKVFITALCTLPIIGQLIGIFMGVFFSTYDDSDRRSFGRALTFLSIFMFVLYFAYIRYALALLQSVDINSLYNSLGQ